LIYIKCDKFFTFSIFYWTKLSQKINSCFSHLSCHPVEFSWQFTSYYIGYAKYEHLIAVQMKQKTNKKLSRHLWQSLLILYICVTLTHRQISHIYNFSLFFRNNGVQLKAFCLSSMMCALFVTIKYFIIKKLIKKAYRHFAF